MVWQALRRALPRPGDPEYFVRWSVPSACAGTDGGFNEHMAATSSSRGPRRDAARNHQTLIRAATAAVHRERPRVPMATIAADAGVGIGTLYRHFATREDLLSHLT